MSALPENELDLDKLFLPAWAQEPASAKHYAHYEGGDERSERRGERPGRRPGRREDRPNRGRDDRPRQPRRERGPAEAEQGRYPKRPEKGRPGFQRGEPRERREMPPPLPDVNITLVPEEKGVESLARQIKATGRAYPLFDIARLILDRPERYSVAFAVKKNSEGQVVQPLFTCVLDESLWLSEDDAVAHVLKNHFGTFYQAERTAAEPPKGKYTFVAQCGMSGVILGPPNYHDYQNQLRKLHAERFSRMPFDVFKSRVKIVRDEEVVKKWIDDLSWKTEYICLNIPEPVRFGSREEVEKHFREVHKENIIKSVEAHTLNGTAARSLRNLDLARLVRQTLESQKRFPLQIATALSQQFAGHGLQFFKVNKTITHVSVARPHFLDLETTPVSEGVKRIVDYINANPRCSRRQLVESLAPTPAAPPAEPSAPGSPATPNQPTPEQTAVIADLHWLIHQGHVIEFANGTIETAKKPLPRPPKPEPKPEGQPAKPEVPVAPAPPAETPVTSESEETGQPASTPEANSAETAAPAETAESSESSPSTQTAESPAPEETRKPETAEPSAAPETEERASDNSASIESGR